MPSKGLVPALATWKLNSQPPHSVHEAGSVARLVESVDQEFRWPRGDACPCSPFLGLSWRTRGLTYRNVVLSHVLAVLCGIQNFSPCVPSHPPGSVVILPHEVFIQGWICHHGDTQVSSKLPGSVQPPCGNPRPKMATVVCRVRVIRS